jgi:hypothetical protein
MEETHFMIVYNISAMPTTYAAVNFRSRLEARYAAFFDLLNWGWEYEPLDSCNGWIPDFRVYLPNLHGGFSLSLLVEVKPTINVHDFVGERVHDLMNDHTEILPCTAVGVCGGNPSIGYWIYRCECHRGVIDGLSRWCPMWEFYWRVAGNRVQWRKAA